MFAFTKEDNLFNVLMKGFSETIRINDLDHETIVMCFDDLRQVS